MIIKEEDFKKIKYYGKYEVIYSVRMPNCLTNRRFYFNSYKQAKKVFNDIHKFVPCEYVILKRYK